jgi:ubiquinone/menaquinone biosynthesis C-methylase UbiE
LTIVEPSDNLVNNQIGNLIPKYIKPSIEGRLPLDEDSIDLITCFGTLHHIPNVSFVLSEIVRVLKPNGHLLLREPIISMGDWQKPRVGLTKNERGIPVSFFDSEFCKYPIKTISKEYCFTVTSILQKTLGKMFKKAIYSFKFYVLFDKYLSTILKKNVKYHAIYKINKIAPSSVFYVIKKLPPKS